MSTIPDVGNEQLASDIGKSAGILLTIWLLLLLNCL
jgi:hypothetical protein